MDHYVFKFIIFIENFSDELNISTKSTLSILLTFAKIYYETLDTHATPLHLTLRKTYHQKYNNNKKNC